jgi:hypothetical protein
MEKPEDEERQREIEDVIHEETARRPVDLEAIREAIRLRRDYRALLRTANEATFRKFLTELGWRPGLPEFESFVREWRALQR